MSECEKNFYVAKTMYFLVIDEKLVTNYNEIWGEIKNIIRYKKV